MPDEDEMTIDERRKYLKRTRNRYWAADRVGRGELLTEMEAVTRLHRKSLIRLVRGPTLERERRRKVRGRSYGPEVEDAVRIVREALDYVCAERLTPAPVPTARRLAGFGELWLTAELESQLSRISRATVQRLMGKPRHHVAGAREIIRQAREGMMSEGLATREILAQADADYECLLQSPEAFIFHGMCLAVGIRR